jgi:hypothetical protein
MRALLEPRAAWADGSLSEAELVQLWEGQRFPPHALLTRGGAPFKVLFRGRICARGPGPDFRDAIIATPSGVQLKGDVELHVRASAFRQHGHHRDPAYDNVVLHVVFQDDDEGTTPLACGRKVPVVALAPWVSQRAQELSRWLAAPGRWQEPCLSARERLGDRTVAAILESASDQRLQDKAATFRRALAKEEPEEILYRALLEACGYSRNREPFHQLAQTLPWRRLRAAILNRPPKERLPTAESILLATAGFSRPLPEEEAPLLPWRTDGLRPENHPLRRLRGAARLLVRHADRGLLGGLEQATARAQETGPQALTSALRVDESAPDGPSARPALIGAGRAREMAVNVVLPFLLAWSEERGDPAPGERALALYRRYPSLPSYGILRTLTAALGRELTTGARRQQGMLHLFHRHCRQGGCTGPVTGHEPCPLA